MNMGQEEHFIRSGFLQVSPTEHSVGTVQSAHKTLFTRAAEKGWEQFYRDQLSRRDEEREGATAAPQNPSFAFVLQPFQQNLQQNPLGLQAEMPWQQCP